jgi:UDP-N-acetylglucosamine--dolichyl-phosphate N-acetylglucosaminephosphotransferase
MLWEDMNKWKHPKNVAASGGIVVVISFIVSVLIYVGLKTFIYSPSAFEIQIFALLTVILFFSLIGLIDDMLGWKNGGLSVRTRIGLSLLASIPLVVINAGNPSVNLPILGAINFGILYPLVIIPLAIAFVSTTFNFLAGFNGLEAGMGILLISFASIVSYVTGSLWLAAIGVCMIVPLIVFLFFNWFPAKVFPGDILTYTIGSLFVSMAILGNFEKAAIIVFIPFLIEVVLKSRGRLAKHSFGVPDKNNNLSLKYDKIYGLTHFSIWFLSKFEKNVKESHCVIFIYLIELAFIVGTLVSVVA